MRPTAEMRFWAKVDKRSECWPWLGTKDRNGYGAFRPVYGRSMVKAHRFAYESAKGPIPAGLEIDHLCRNRSCVRPDHMEAVTRAENVRRSRPDTCRLGHPLEMYGGERCCPICRRQQMAAYQRRKRAEKRAATASPNTTT